VKFGKRLKELRESRKVTQQQLADVLKVNRSTIAGYETKDKSPDYDRLKLIAQFFDVTIDYLLGMEPKEITNDITLATHRTNFDDDLPEEARNELEEYLNYLRFKYNTDKK
jgi:transcriptional regulator with XRE-family HTH domain